MLEEYDSNGLLYGMTPAEHAEVKRLIEDLPSTGWLLDLSNHNTEYQAEALDKLAAAAERFVAFTQVQHRSFLAEYRPRGLPFSSLLQIAASFGLATPIA